IAQINVQISEVEAGGMHANDLRDQRDALLDKLSSLVKISTTESADGQDTVYVNGHQLVDRNQVHAMVANMSPGVATTVSWQDDGTSINLATAGGQLQ